MIKTRFQTAETVSWSKTQDTGHSLFSVSWTHIGHTLDTPHTHRAGRCDRTARSSFGGKAIRLRRLVH